MSRGRTIFITKIRTHAGKAAARLLIESIQSFGGEMSGNSIWLFAVDPQNLSCQELASPQVQVFPLRVPEVISNYPFGDKVQACARAEEMAESDVRSLIWLDMECLVVQPPVLFNLSCECDCALRPVHIRNVGLSPSEPLDAFWKGIYASLEVDDVQNTVTTFIDHQLLRAYYNSHGLSVNPAQKLFQRWYRCFEMLVEDENFQAAACRDDIHRIFLFQALFSALVSTSLDARRVCILPPTYNYPYNLHNRVPEDQRAAALNDLVYFTFEGRTLLPARVTDIEIRDPLRAWLIDRDAYLQELSDPV